jgi:hypothetical protein
MNTEVTFLRALIVQGDRIYIASAMDTSPPDAEHTRLYHYDAKRAHPWSFHDVGHWITALEKLREGSDDVWTLCALSRQGELELASQGKAIMETVADAGLARPEAPGYGYVKGIKNIEGRLHVCGGAGQVYKRLGVDRWVHMDDGLLQAPDVEDRLLLAEIDGLTESDIYVAGNFPGSTGREGRLFHWNGTCWRRIDLPVVGGLNAICIESAQRVWVAGQKGSLLVGNHLDGFENLSPNLSSQLYHDLAVYDGCLYLGSNFGLFRYDEERRRVVRVRTGLSTELSYIATVDHADGVLWAVGPKDIAYFDGKVWTRLQNPHNPPVDG